MGAHPPPPHFLPLLLSLALLAPYGCRAGCASGIGDVATDSHVSTGSKMSLAATEAAVRALAIINAKNHHVTSTQVESAVTLAAASAGVDTARLAALLLRGSVWGSLDSLNSLRDAMRSAGVRALTDGRGAGLSDVLYYLFMKKCEDSTVSSFLAKVDEPPLTAVPAPRRASRTGLAILLDPITMARMGEPAAREHLARGGGRLLFAAVEGWEGGLTPFNQLSLDRAVARLAERLAGAEERCAAAAGPHAVPSHDGDEEGECISRLVFRGPTEAAIRGLLPNVNMEEQLVWLRHPTHAVGPLTLPSPGTPPGQDVYQAIAARLVGHSMPGPEDLALALTGAAGCPSLSLNDPPETVEQVGEFVAKYAGIVSLNRLAAAALALEPIVQRTAAGDGGVTTTGLGGAMGGHVPTGPGPAPTSLLCIMERFKSAALVSHLYLTVTGRPARDAVWCGQDRYNEVAPFVTLGSPLLVLLDDLALSGEQQTRYYKALTAGPLNPYKLTARRGPTTSPRVAVAPLMFTREAAAFFQSEKVTALGGGEELPVPPERVWMVANGYSGQHMMIALPYMAPDNNNYYFRNFIADLFTFNSCGVQLRAAGKPVRPDCRRRDQDWMGQVVMCLMGINFCTEPPKSS